MTAPQLASLACVVIIAAHVVHGNETGLNSEPVYLSMLATEQKRCPSSNLTCPNSTSTKPDTAVAPLNKTKREGSLHQATCSAFAVTSTFQIPKRSLVRNFCAKIAATRRAANRMCSFTSSGLTCPETLVVKADAANILCKGQICNAHDIATCCEDAGKAFSSDGPCVITGNADNGCITSPNYPLPYTNESQSCNITVKSSGAVTIMASNVRYIDQLRTCLAVGVNETAIVVAGQKIMWATMPDSSCRVWNGTVRNCEIESGMGWKFCYHKPKRAPTPIPDYLSLKGVPRRSKGRSCQLGKGISITDVAVVGYREPIATPSCMEPVQETKGGCKIRCIPEFSAQTNNQPTFCAINCIKAIVKKFFGQKIQVFCHFQKQVLCPVAPWTNSTAKCSAGKKCLVTKQARVLGVKRETNTEEGQTTEGLVSVEEASKNFTTGGSFLAQYEAEFGVCRDVVLAS